MMQGFGLGFYGFFVAATLWLVIYFLWAWRAARRDRLDQRSPDGR